MIRGVDCIPNLQSNSSSDHSYIFPSRFYTVFNRRRVFCIKKKKENNIKDIGLVRIEQLYPFPYDDLEEILTKYENVQEFVWCQEEPLNQGAWFSHRHRIQRVIDRIDTSKEVSLVSRPAAAAPAVGLMKLHLQQQEELVNKALIK